VLSRNDDPGLTDIDALHGDREKKKNSPVAPRPAGLLFPPGNVVPRRLMPMRWDRRTSR
jgi:hypothetical protein